ncbi:MAG: proton-conducting transporter membrane subunit [Cyanobium sp.]
MSKALLANLLITWLLLPYAAAFLGALLPRLARWFALLSGLVTLVVGAWCLMGGSAALDLIGPLGVLLRVDGLAAPFLLLNALVLLAVLAERWRRLPEGPFLVLLPLLLGGLNATAVAVDLVSLYVALEVVGITAFLLILRNRDAGQLWIALRYLLVGNSVMTLYLVGVALLYLQSGSFRFSALAALPPADPARAVILALVLVGLFTKGGLFLSGLWLPQTHAEAPADVSALLSGMAVAGGLCPLLRLAEQLPFLQPLLAWLGLASAVLGLVYALMESDLKRLLAWSTLSQVGLVVIHPPVGGLVALAHGLAKASLFLLAGHLPSRRLEGWSRRPLPLSLALPLLLASLSIAGAPPLLGFRSKEALFSAPLQAASILPGFASGWLPALLSVGTAAVYARLCWMPVHRGPSVLASGAIVLTIPLLMAPLLPLPLAGAAMAAATVAKALAVLAAGAGVEALRQLAAELRPGLSPGLCVWRLPDLERLEDLFGCMAVMGLALLLLLWTRPGPLAVVESGVPWPV